jgi:SAM-dependent methyltransferase
MEDEIRTRGHSEKDLTVDASAFYENYWHEAPVISAVTLYRNKSILDRFFPDRPQKQNILEIGVGGEGGIIFSLRNTNNVFGIDVSTSAKRNCERLGLKIDLINLDVQPIPFEEEFFDIVFAFEVFEHFANPQRAIEEIRRVLKPRGFFLISIPNPLIHHWPRLFYPGLFEEKAFCEFLMINEFKIHSKLNLGQNMYYPIFQDPGAQAFMWCWHCEKIDRDPQTLLEYGLYFWEQTNSEGIKTRPIEAIDLFRKSLDYGGPYDIQARLFHALSLLYRYIYRETEEFLNQAEWFMDKAQSDRYPLNLHSIFALLVLNDELKKFGHEFIDRENYESIVCGFRSFPGSEPYLKWIDKGRGSLLDYRAILELLKNE